MLKVSPEQPISFLSIGNSGDQTIQLIDLAGIPSTGDNITGNPSIISLETET